MRAPKMMRRGRWGQCAMHGAMTACPAAVACSTTTKPITGLALAAVFAPPHDACNGM